MTRHPGAGARAGAGARRGPQPGADAAGAAAARRPARRAAGAGARGADEVVRTRRRGRGHHQPQDRRLPRGLPLLFAVRAFRVAGAQRVAGHPEPGRGRQADRQDRRDRVLHRRRRARTRRAAAGPGRRGHRGDPQRGRHPDRLLAGHADPGAGRAARPRWACTATTTTWRPRGRSSPTSSPPTPGRSAGTPCRWSARRAWRCAAAASSAWAKPSSSARSSPPTSPSSIRTRCR